jgi:large subunit ribosomal protein L30
MATLQVTQRRSSSGSNKRQLDTLRSLGLRRIGHTVEVKDCEQARGMVHAVRHLVEVHVPEGHTGTPKRTHPDGHTQAGTGKRTGKQEQSP